MHHERIVGFLWSLMLKRAPSQDCTSNQLATLSNLVVSQNTTISACNVANSAVARACFCTQAIFSNYQIILYYQKLCLPEDAQDTQVIINGFHKACDTVLTVTTPLPPLLSSTTSSITTTSRTTTKPPTTITTTSSIQRDFAPSLASVGVSGVASAVGSQPIIISTPTSTSTSSSSSLRASTRVTTTSLTSIGAANVNTGGVFCQAAINQVTVQQQAYEACQQLSTIGSQVSCTCGIAQQYTNALLNEQSSCGSTDDIAALVSGIIRSFQDLGCSVTTQTAGLVAQSSTATSGINVIQNTVAATTAAPTVLRPSLTQSAASPTTSKGFKLEYRDYLLTTLVLMCLCMLNL